MAAEPSPSERALLGILALQAADRAEREREPRIATELVLHGAGFSNAEIAAIIDEKSGTVAKRIERAKKAAEKSKKSAGSKT
jgi:DNA-directed RNA polymerase specialized sigma24 family protein